VFISSAIYMLVLDTEVWWVYRICPSWHKHLLGHEIHTKGLNCPEMFHTPHVFKQLFIRISEFDVSCFVFDHCSSVTVNIIYVGTSSYGCFLVWICADVSELYIAAHNLLLYYTFVYKSFEIFVNFCRYVKLTVVRWNIDCWSDWQFYRINVFFYGALVVCVWSVFNGFKQNASRMMVVTTDTRFSIEGTFVIFLIFNIRNYISLR
jgi:hypothetical protein